MKATHMSTIRDWFWAIEATGQGPYYYFTATFAESDAERLAARIKQHPLPGFGHCHFVGSLIGAPCGTPSYHGPYDLYIDQSNHATLAEGLASTPPRLAVAHAIWHLLGVCGSEFGIECAYGGLDQQDTQAENALIAMLAQSADLTLVHWQIFSGGDGYAACFVQSGRSAAELLAYLQQTALEKPDFTEVQQALQQALSQPEFANSYRLGGWTVDEWQARVVVLHTIEKLTQYGAEAWDMAPHTTALDQVARTVHAQCKLPVSLAGAAHDPQDFNRLIGSVIAFGYAHPDRI